MKHLGSLIGMIILVMTCWGSSAFAQTESYVAIGDSLAAGQTPFQQIDAGYSDLIAMRLQAMDQLKFYTKELAFPGFTTANVLERIKTEEARDLLANATLVTVSAGANDLLSLVRLNPTAGTLTFSQLQADYALNIVRKNMEAILNELGVLAPKAQVYVIGYYFAYPAVHLTQKEGTNAQLVKLNTILQQQAELAGAVYVNVYDSFGLNATNYLPNYADVHPNMEGYRQMANAFLKAYSGSDALNIASSQLPQPNPLSFEEILKERTSTQPKQQKVTTSQSVENIRSIQGFHGYTAFMGKLEKR
ncbi:SGNH/GDSL hydrolase family protein [Lysinibacillus fusiformis]|jgi:lysophospholipase L1-like esterase|uniref:SGNH/GDSL hydrolase family protein n=2 Tax=Lysinibacillus TaxID=400634 RepID=UPI0004D9C544|nr:MULTISPECIES: SGNH/GDSL hydrolase family protein [Lysinibacillus]AJK86374.1 lysophospholipase [Lysinibacillus fusiformis]KHK50283.1 lysophospholipase [Lysinibacillus sp. A1]MCK1990615.1 SGNH/GDSL hydrolase family protein [Lysinibacillus fusiformis]QDZ97709.1 SGNH/GDSL hydrolase family protein [Lysinibacillus fusiformis]WEA38778.1 SGNH/GDSL hydrolase family protein [Lysinibacillus fusiformis]